MVLGKIKDIVKNRREQNDEKQSVNLGFKTVSEYHKFKQDVKNDVRKKIRTKTQKQKSRTTKKENHTKRRRIITEKKKFYRILRMLWIPYPFEDLILIFDDISLVFKLKEGQAKKSEILSALTEARHPKFASEDRKVIIIANIHYMNSIERNV